MICNAPITTWQTGDEVEGRAFAWRGKQVIERNLAVFEAAGPNAGKEE